MNKNYDAVQSRELLRVVAGGEADFHTRKILVTLKDFDWAAEAQNFIRDNPCIEFWNLDDAYIDYLISNGFCKYLETKQVSLDSEMFKPIKGWGK